jgi:hypothetical protein
MRKGPFVYHALGLLALVALVGGVPAEAAETVRESSTDVEFPVERHVAGSERPLALTGTGVRKKLFFKVYGFAFYVEPEIARRHLREFAGRPAEQLKGTKAVYDMLIELPAPRLVVMHFVRDVDGESMRDALASSLEPVPDGHPAKERFLGLWKEPIPSGTEVALLFDPGGEVLVLRDGQELGIVRSEALATALLRTWLGPEPISWDIREGAVERLPEVLAGADR